MGPSGAGKSVVGAALATRLGLPFHDADDMHPPANIAKMSAGTPLDDADRAPWLDRVGAVLAGAEDGAVVACSALARRYRDRIAAGAPDAIFVQLGVPPARLAQRMATREHFMPGSLLASQMRTLEDLAADENGFRIENDSDLASVVDAIVAELRRR
jgi:carbohydrate kinase (thermoresistant glucokinase family)